MINKMTHSKEEVAFNKKGNVVIFWNALFKK